MVLLDIDGSKCRFRSVKDVFRVILVRVRGWDKRFNEVIEELIKKGFLLLFDKLKFEGRMFMDEFVENIVVVRKLNCLCYCIVGCIVG